MKNKKRIMAVLLGAVFLLSGCGAEENIKNVKDTENSISDHDPITLVAQYKDMSAFIELVHAQYPEINMEIIPYSGANYTAYVDAQLESGEMPDIYCTKVYLPGQKDLSDKLIDLSGYDFLSEYSEARLKDVSDDGKIYLVPNYYDCVGITYNKTLLEKHGWTLPKSFRELEALAPKVEAAGCQLALNQIQYPGYAFQYMCNILDTHFLNTIDGRLWQKEFLTGEATVTDTPEMMESMHDLDKWRDLGMLNGNGAPMDDEKNRKIMAEGNTLFLLGSSNTFTKEETTDEFGLMPYLSEDGSQNAYILSVSRYIGLNKKLEEPGNEQKLEDAIHIMEVLSTVDGMRAFNSYYSGTSMLPLKEYHADENSKYADIQDELENGFTAPFIYSGWENILVDVGDAMQAYIKGEKNLDDLVNTLDEKQSLLWDNSDSVYTTVTETINNNDCARLVGICLAQASDADLALVSTNQWYELKENEQLNAEGVSGELYPVPVTDLVITSILPTGWQGDIQNVTLTGKRIQELAESGYDKNGNGDTFPYVLVTPDNFEIEDDTTYTVAICGVTEEVAKEGNLTDTGILGLKAAEDYFSQFETFSAKDIKWER
ncbi:MAG: ABC transporter substrate-binding protein [Lachnospiraceae bacterium]|nr:ABC transporter substrate-binding protein [Lachnospiraceae bacterium]